MKGAASATTAANSKDGCAAHNATTASVAMSGGGKCDAKGAALGKGAACPMHGSATRAGTEVAFKPGLERAFVGGNDSNQDLKGAGDADEDSAPETGPAGSVSVRITLATTLVKVLC